MRAVGGNRNPRHYDAIVVGAGPAGAATALYARRAGMDVLLVDKRVFPRDKICGDAIARKSVSFLRDLGLLDRVRLETHEPIGRAVLSSPRGQEVGVDLSSESEPKPHLVCRREIFDSVLVEAARRELDVVEGSAVTDLVRDNGRVRGVVCRCNGSEQTILARVVVGADGYDSIVARRLALYRHDASRWFVATRGYYRGLDVARGTVEVHFLEGTLPGFLWMFPTGDGVTNVGLGLVHRELKRRRVRLREVHEAALASPRLYRRFRRAERIGAVYGWHLPTPDRRRTLAGPGYLLVGDAAGLVDPFSGEGIGNALQSAQVAAGVMAEACGNERSVDALAAYPRCLRRAIDAREIALHYRLRSLARRGRVIDFLVGRAVAHRDVVDWFRAMTSERGSLSRKRELLSPFTYARLLARRR